MRTISKLGTIVAIAASTMTPALAQTPYGGYYGYYRGSAWSDYYSNHPAATGGGSLGYNENSIYNDR